jgi:hypothetical protein
MDDRGSAGCRAGDMNAWHARAVAGPYGERRIRVPFVMDLLGDPRTAVAVDQSRRGAGVHPSAPGSGLTMVLFTTGRTTRSRSGYSPPWSRHTLAGAARSPKRSRPPPLVGQKDLATVSLTQIANAGGQSTVSARKGALSPDTSTTWHPVKGRARGPEGDPLPPDQPVLPCTPAGDHPKRKPDAGCCGLKG